MNPYPGGHPGGFPKAQDAHALPGTAGADCDLGLAATRTRLDRRTDGAVTLASVARRRAFGQLHQLAFSEKLARPLLSFLGMENDMNSILGVTLPPGPVEPAIFDRLLEIAIGPHGWIRPISYGSGSPDEIVLRENEDAIAAIHACMLEDGSVLFADHSGLGCVNVRADRHRLSYDGIVYVEGDWVHFVSRLAGSVGTVAEIMALLRSPFAFAAASDAVDALALRGPWNDGGDLVLGRLGGYSMGLDQPHFRMWFGVEWTDFLGRDVLAKAPAIESRPEGAGWFVQLFEVPEDWNQPAGIAAAREFAASLGKNVFHDPEQPDRPLEAPDLSHLMRAAKIRYPHLKQHLPGWPAKLPPQ